MSRQFPSASYHHETDMETLARNYGEIVSLKPNRSEIWWRHSRCSWIQKVDRKTTKRWWKHCICYTELWAGGTQWAWELSSWCFRRHWTFLSHLLLAPMTYPSQICKVNKTLFVEDLPIQRITPSTFDWFNARAVNRCIIAFHPVSDGVVGNWLIWSNEWQLMRERQLYKTVFWILCETLLWHIV